MEKNWWLIEIIVWEMGFPEGTQRIITLFGEESEAVEEIENLAEDGSPVSRVEILSSKGERIRRRDLERNNSL